MKRKSPDFEPFTVNDKPCKKMKSPEFYDQKEFNCFCGKSYKKEAWLKKHMVNLQNKNKP